MKIKGTFYVTTKTAMAALFGQERWDSFMIKLAEKDPYFKNVIMSITLIPVEKLIVIFDEMCKEFFDGDYSQYSMFGKVGARVALSPDGPYKSYLLSRDLKQFVDFALPKLWATYFDGGVCTTKLENNVIHFRVTGVQFKHLYFEQLLMGYFQKAIKVFGKKTVAKQVKSLVAGDGELYFQYALKDA